MVHTTLRRGLLLLGALALVALTTAFVPEAAQAVPASQTAPGNNPPPDVGAVILADPTLSSFGSHTCPTGRNKAEPVGEGYILKVTGKCFDESTLAAAPYRIHHVSFPDGEVRLDFKVVSGHDRASFILGFRQQPDNAEYQVRVTPASNRAILFGNSDILADRRDLNGVISRDDWNTLAVRARGSELWVLLNDQLVLQGNDPTHDRGVTQFVLQRFGDINDEAESAVVIRNLRISSLASGDPSRAPTIQQVGSGG